MKSQAERIWASYWTPLLWMLLDIHKEGNPMTQRKDTMNLSRMPFQFMGMDDPLLSMLEWLN